MVRYGRTYSTKEHHAAGTETNKNQGGLKEQLLETDQREKKYSHTPNKEGEGR